MAVFIVTPVSRPQNLPTIAATIPRGCIWVLAFDACVDEAQVASIRRRGIGHIHYETGVSGFWGKPQINYALDKLNLSGDRDWLHVLDDDNVMHPEWWHQIVKHIDTTNTSLLAWGQQFKCGKERLPWPTEFKVGAVDQASYMWQPMLTEQADAFDLGYEADGRLAARLALNCDLYDRASVVIQKHLCFYNYLAETPHA